MYKRVLVPLDGSSLAESIMPFILQIAGPLDMEVVLLRVLQPLVPVVIEGSRHVEAEDPETRQADARSYLECVAASLIERGVRVSTEVRDGNPAEEIVAVARTVGADMIAMTTHGRTGLGRLLFGSVAQAVLRQAEIPVLLLRQTERAAREARR